MTQFNLVEILSINKLPFSSMSLHFAAIPLGVLLFLRISISTAYESKYDGIDLDEVLVNDRLRTNYVKCLLNEGPCTPDAQELKSA